MMIDIIYQENVIFCQIVVPFNEIEWWDRFQTLDCFVLLDLNIVQTSPDIFISPSRI